jgi:hypothetical protein
MLAEVAATSLNDPISWAVVLSHRQDFVWILFLSLALTAAAVPLIVRAERSRLHAVTTSTSSNGGRGSRIASGSRAGR